MVLRRRLALQARRLEQDAEVVVDQRHPVDQDGLAALDHLGRVLLGIRDLGPREVATGPPVVEVGNGPEEDVVLRPEVLGHVDLAAVGPGHGAGLLGVGRGQHPVHQILDDDRQVGRTLGAD